MLAAYQSGDYQDGSWRGRRVRVLQIKAHELINHARHEAMLAECYARDALNEDSIP